jgi:hypothetical protein
MLYSRVLEAKQGPGKADLTRRKFRSAMSHLILYIACSLDGYIARPIGIKLRLLVAGVDSC